ncbi:MAG: L-ribulose-5-phosphate 4-epimerase [Lentisphaeria bacterium]|nr:L-ribulose-5-phosphate 4-epimerase [Lentisphaeria bacterium]
MYDELKQECFEANLQLPKLQLVIYTFGNVSCADHSKGIFAIKPSGVDYETMRWQDMVIVDFEGRKVGGDLRYSSDTPTHAVLYREFPNTGSIVHTHSTYAVAWAQAHRAVPIYGTTHADHLPCDIPCTPPLSPEQINGEYEVETGNQIVDHFKTAQLNPEEVPMVLVSEHGPFVWGRNSSKAVYHAKVLEELCRMALLTEQINPQAPRASETLIARHYQRKHGDKAYYGQTK